MDGVEYVITYSNTNGLNVIAWLANCHSWPRWSTHPTAQQLYLQYVYVAIVRIQHVDGVEI